MSTRLRIGVAGAGLIGRRHIALIDASQDCVLAGIADQPRGRFAIWIEPSGRV